MRFWKKLVLFCVGGGSYVGLEFLWRGRSHISMFAAGGLCFLLLGKLGKHRQPLGVKALLGSVVITAVELLTGLLFNRHYSVWDYRDMPLNLWGQICLPFSAMWAPLSLAAMMLYRKLSGLFLCEEQ